MRTARRSRELVRVLSRSDWYILNATLLIHTCRHLEKEQDLLVSPHSQVVLGKWISSGSCDGKKTGPDHHRQSTVSEYDFIRDAYFKNGLIWRVAGLLVYALVTRWQPYDTFDTDACLESRCSFVVVLRSVAAKPRQH